jgi:hypothetical protein
MRGGSWANLYTDMQTMFADDTIDKRLLSFAPLLVRYRTASFGPAAR